VAEAINVLKAVFEGSSEVELKLETHLFGGCAIDETGEALPASTLQACKEADAILMGMKKAPPCEIPTTDIDADPLLASRRLHWRSKVGRQQQSAP
jgi:3-isopropylmalate dehydrogenase